jgi:hypothetical protein
MPNKRPAKQRNAFHRNVGELLPDDFAPPASRLYPSQSMMAEPSQLRREYYFEEK